MTLDQFQHLKQWHLGHGRTHAVEGHVWDAVVMCWMAGWIGVMPATFLGAAWALPLCLAGAVLPDLYAVLRVGAHRRNRLRCDWLCALERRSLARRPHVRR